MSKSELVEYCAEMCRITLDVPIEELEGFFDDVLQRVGNDLSEQGYKFYEGIKRFIVEYRMEKALN